MLDGIFLLQKATKIEQIATEKAAEELKDVVKADVLTAIKKRNRVCLKRFSDLDSEVFSLRIGSVSKIHSEGLKILYSVILPFLLQNS